MTKFASLCLLAYKRPQQLLDCINSLTQTCDYPYQLIVNLDTYDKVNLEHLTNLLTQSRISNLLINNGNNRGVGRSFQSCLGVAEGDFIFKIDTDLTFKPAWLSKAVKVLENNPDVGAVSLFDYNHYDPNDDRFKSENSRLEEREDCYIVKDFVSSIYGFKKEHLFIINPVEDDGNHTKFQNYDLGGGVCFNLAITKEDLVTNSGFGVYKSTYVSGTEENPYKTPIFDEPLIFLRGLGA